MNPKMPCDVCGYVHPTRLAGLVVYENPDGIVRCKHCRQRAEYGNTFHTAADEKAAEKSGARKPIRSIEESIGVYDDNNFP